MVESRAVQFAETARSLSNRARSLGLDAPIFRSPPRRLGVSRTLRRRPDGQPVVAISIRGRPWAAVVSDLIEGVLVVNSLVGADLVRARDDLWQHCAESIELAA